MSPERRAVLLLLGLAVLGQGVRTWLAAPGAPPGEVRLLGAGPAGTPTAHRDSSLARARPLGAGETIDLDRAGAAEIARLPRVGAGLARKIVADREARGPFGALEGLDRVPGIGPGLLTAIGPHARFSDSAARRLGGLASQIPSAPASPGGTPEPPNLRTAPPLDLNTATAAELEALPFVGPYMAQQIVAHRERHGRFTSVDSLVRVPGVGPATVARIRDHLRVDP